MQETIALNRKQVKELFLTHHDQCDVIIQLYKMVFPNWDDIDSIQGWPTVSNSTWKFICDLFINFDQKNHPTVMKGGLWLNKGFKSYPNIPDNIIDLSQVKIRYNDKEQTCASQSHIQNSENARRACISTSFII